MICNFGRQEAKTIKIKPKTDLSKMTKTPLVCSVFVDKSKNVLSFVIRDARLFIKVAQENKSF